MTAVGWDPPKSKSLHRTSSRPPNTRFISSPIYSHEEETPSQLIAIRVAGLQQSQEWKFPKNNGEEFLQ